MDNSPFYPSLYRDPSRPKPVRMPGMPWPEEPVNPEPQNTGPWFAPPKPQPPDFTPHDPYPGGILPYWPKLEKPLTPGVADGMRGMGHDMKTISWHPPTFPSSGPASAPPPAGGAPAPQYLDRHGRPSVAVMVPRGQVGTPNPQARMNPQPPALAALPLQAGRHPYADEDRSNPLRPRGPKLLAAWMWSHPLMKNRLAEGDAHATGSGGLRAAPLNFPLPDDASGFPAASEVMPSPRPEPPLTTDPDSYLQPTVPGVPRPPAQDPAPFPSHGEIGRLAPALTPSPGPGTQTPIFRDMPFRGPSSLRFVASDAVSSNVTGDESNEAQPFPPTAPQPNPSKGTPKSIWNFDDDASQPDHPINNYLMTGGNPHPSALAFPTPNSTDTHVNFPWQQGGWFRGDSATAAHPTVDEPQDRSGTAWVSPRALRTPSEKEPSSAVREWEQAHQRLLDFTSGGEPYVIMNGDPMKMTPTVRGLRPLPVADAEEHLQAYDWLNQRAHLQDEVNRLKPAADYEREMAEQSNAAQEAGGKNPGTARGLDPLRQGDSQWVSAEKSEQQKMKEKIAGQIAAVPEAKISREEYDTVHNEQAWESAKLLGGLWRDVLSGSAKKGGFPSANAYMEAQVRPRWQSLEDKMKEELDAGRPHEAAKAIRQIYSDMAAGGMVKGEPTASRFMDQWLKNDPDPNRVVPLEQEEMVSALKTPNTQNTLADSLMKQRPDLAKGGARDIKVEKLILAEIQTGEGNRDLFHTLGQFTLEFTGTIHRGDPVEKEGVSTTPITFDGSFTFHDTYDWGDSHGKSIDIMGFPISDSYGNLVEKQGLANKFQVGGTLNTKVTGQTNKGPSSDREDDDFM